MAPSLRRQRPGGRQKRGPGLRAGGLHLPMGAKTLLRADPFQREPVRLAWSRSHLATRPPASVLARPWATRLTKRGSGLSRAAP